MRAEKGYGYVGASMDRSRLHATSDQTAPRRFARLIDVIVLGRYPSPSTAVSGITGNALQPEAPRVGSRQRAGSRRRAQSPLWRSPQLAVCVSHGACVASAPDKTPCSASEACA